MFTVSIRFFVGALSAVALFGLAACGDGWEMVPYHGTPYNGRTAGTGVAYVRAHMPPAKGPILPAVTAPPKVEAPVAPVVTPAPAPVKPAEDADKVFRAKQKK